MLSATASLGLLLLWDVDGGLTQIDKYLYSSEEYIKAGALLACGIVNTGVRNECDPALALLSDYVLHSSNVMRIGAILGKFCPLYFQLVERMSYDRLIFSNNFILRSGIGICWFQSRRCAQLAAPCPLTSKVVDGSCGCCRPCMWPSSCGIL